jgi:oligopeptide transport system substrate-binding protein
MKKATSLVFAVVFAVLVAGGLFAQAGNAQVVKYAVQTEPISMDPHVGNDAVTSTALLMAFEPLLNNVNGKIVGGMAEKWTVSKDGLTYTFALRNAKWSDGKAMTAADFADTFKRMLTRKDAMDLAYLIFPIKNAQEVNAGTKDVSELGVRVVNDKTLEITLGAPTPFMATLLTSSYMVPIRMDLAQKYGNEYGSAPDKIVSNGPYLLKDWRHGDRMIFVKNPGYWNASAVKLNEVDIVLVADDNTRKNMFVTGDIDFLQLTPDQIPSSEKMPEFKYYNSGGMTFIIYSVKATSPDRAKILQNRNFQAALAYAVDREDFVKALYPMNSPFTGVINPDISDGMGGKWGDFGKITDKYFKIRADIPKAKDYMAKAVKELGYASVSDMPAFDFIARNNALSRSTVEYFQDLWLKTLGVKATPRLLDYAQFWENLYGAPYDICMSGWMPDYDDPFTYLDMWDSRGGWNKTGWVGQNFYELTAKANQQTNMKTRNQMFADAEKIMLTEAPIMPLLTRRGAYLMRSSKIPDMYICLFGIFFDFRYAHLAK